MGFVRSYLTITKSVELRIITIGRGREGKRLSQCACIFVPVHKKGQKKIHTAATVLVTVNEMVIKPQLVLIIYFFLSVVFQPGPQLMRIFTRQVTKTSIPRCPNRG